MKVFLVLLGLGVIVSAQFNGFLDALERPSVDSIGMDEPWKVFYFGPLGSLTLTRFEFTTKEYSYLELTDLHCKGDQFGVFDHDSLLGSTSDAQADCTKASSDPSETIIEPGWSNGKFFLPKGTHNVTILALKSPFHEGVAAIRLTSVTPILH